MELEFKNEIHEKVHGNIKEWGRELYGETLRLHDDGDFSIDFGSAIIYISPWSWSEDECIIHIWTPLIDEIEITTDLTRYLLEQNLNMPPFGGFSIGTVTVDRESKEYLCLEESMVGSSATKHELRQAVYIMGQMADDYDDKIRSKWGGKRHRDR